LCASFCRSNAYGATQQFHQWKIFNVKRKLEEGRRKLEDGLKAFGKVR
jgi:hypothetical protein